MVDEAGGGVGGGARSPALLLLLLLALCVSLHHVVVGGRNVIPVQKICKIDEAAAQSRIEKVLLICNNPSFVLEENNTFGIASRDRGLENLVC